MEHENRKPGALILGGSFHSLGAARNLAHLGVQVCVMDSGACVSRFSRSVRCQIDCPPTEEEEEYVQFLLSTADDEDMGGWVVFPSTDETVRILAQHHDRLSERFRLTTPLWDTVKYLYDKRLTHQLASDRGVPTPDTWVPGSVDKLETLDLEFPVVIKPVVSKQFMAATRKKALRANDLEELIQTFEMVATIVEPSQILVQELIPGRAENLYSFVGFFKDGRPAAGLSARRPRQHPMEFGRASTHVETVYLPELEEMATRLLTGLAYTGLAEVEFMYDQRDERFELLEVNPRFWGWHTIAIRAGLDLPYLAYADAVGQEYAVGPVREDVKWVRLVTDIPTVLSEILSGGLTVRDYLASMSGATTFAVLSLSDPLPFAADLFLGPYNYVKNRGF